MRLDTFGSLDALPDDARALLGCGDFFSTEAWFRLICDLALPAGAAPLFLVFRDGWGPAAVLPMLRSEGGLAALTTVYTSVYGPVWAPDCDRRAVGEAAGRFMRAWPSVRLDALADDDELVGFVEGLRRAGLAVRPFAHFGNWHERVGGLDWSAYLAARPGQLKETLRRKWRKASALRFQTLDGHAGLETGIDAYAAVYAASWKQAEPFPDFAAGLIRAAARAGVLRLGLCWKDERPLAAQIWVVHGRQASVHKLAHDETAKSDSPGTLLTAFVLRTLLDGGTVDEIDFGRGDDGYKESWASRRRQRVGILAINPRRPAGAAMLVRDWVGGGRRVFLRRFNAGRSRSAST